MKTRLVIVAVAALALGLFVLVYRGPGWVPLRHTGGDVAAGALVFALTGALARRRSVRWWAGVAALFAASVEGVQALELVGPDAPRWVHLTLGSTFDPLDLLAYAVGIGLAAAFVARHGLDRGARVDHPAPDASAGEEIRCRPSPATDAPASPATAAPSTRPIRRTSSR